MNNMKRIFRKLFLPIFLPSILVSCQLVKPLPAPATETPDLPTATSLPTDIPDLQTATPQASAQVTEAPQVPTKMADDPPKEAIILEPAHKLFLLEEDFLEHRCLPIRPENYGDLAIGHDKYYYALGPWQQILFEYDLSTGLEKEIARTSFPDGFLTNILFYEDWLLYLDLENPYASGNWKLMALRLEDYELIVVNKPKDSWLNAANRYSELYDNKVYQTEVVVWNEAPEKSNRLLMFDLETQTETVLLDFEIEDTIFTIIGVTDGYLVLDKTPIDGTVKYLTNIVLVSLDDMSFTELAVKAPVSGPTIQYPWVVWKNAYRNEYSKVGTLYNIETKKRYYHDIPGDYTSGHVLKGKNMIAWHTHLFDVQRLNLTLLYSIDENIYYFIGDKKDVSWLTFEDIQDGYLYWNVKAVHETADLSSTICRVPWSEIVTNAKDYKPVEPTPNPDW